VSGKVRIELSRDGGATWKALANSTANTGALSWKVTKPYDPGADSREQRAYPQRPGYE